MSEIIFNPNTYAGRAAGGYISQTLLGARSLQRNLMRVIPNIKKKAVIRGLEQDVIFQNASCTFNASGDTTIDERYLSPVEMSVMYELCFKDLHESWEADMLNGGSGKEELPADLAVYLINRMQAKIAQGIEKLVWLGKTGSEFAFSAAYPGLLSLMEADANVTKISASIGQLAISSISIASNAVVTVASTATLKTGDRVTIVGANNATLVGGASINGQSFTITVASGTTFTLGATTTGTATSSAGYVQFINESNVIDVLKGLFNQVPEQLRHASDFKLMVPFHVADAYRLAQAANSTGAGSWYLGDKPMDFLGLALEELPFCTANTVVAARTSNLFFGTDLMGDFNQIQVIDMRHTTADQKVRFRAQFASDVNYGYGSEITVYRAG